MKSKSIFIAADLIPALLDGRKKCMRRIMKPQPTGEYARTFSEIAMYQPGDILYVRETWHKYIKRVGKGESCHFTDTKQVSLTQKMRMSRGNRRHVCQKKPHGSGLRSRMCMCSVCRKLQKMDVLQRACIHQIAEDVMPHLDVIHVQTKVTMKLMNFRKSGIAQ